ncbi:hypothetical protein FNV43_RR23282 [Rhamnella rubrinervis]|uniref:Cytochrome P450 n=1 Tax=Rhamnella rubrinervis TaxID=2594499 RepID=A0A8K0DS06_9ROSA|nr:hypothetical protein FNV43_RR23282 [Rhamnella rubrinervis]
MSPHKLRRVQFNAEILHNSSSATFVFRHIFGRHHIVTANPDVVKHILKNRFPNYQKGDAVRIPLTDFLGDIIFNAEGDNWKFQRRVSIHEFNSKSLRMFVETVVDTELYDRLHPILSNAAPTNPFWIFKIFFNASLLITYARSLLGMMLLVYYLLSHAPHLLWLSMSPPILAPKVRDFATNIVREKKKDPMFSEKKCSLDDESSLDWLSRFLKSGNSEGENTKYSKKSTTTNPLRPRRTSAYEEVKDVVYAHVALCEIMGLYSPVPVDNKVAAGDDVSPEGTVVKKGERVAYRPHTKGRLATLWGEAWGSTGQSGGWIGKRRLRSGGVLSQFRVVPAMPEDEPVFVNYLTSRMKDGFPLIIHARGGTV